MKNSKKCAMRCDMTHLAVLKGFYLLKNDDERLRSERRLSSSLKLLSLIIGAMSSMNLA